MPLTENTDHTFVWACTNAPCSTASDDYLVLLKSSPRATSLSRLTRMLRLLLLRRPSHRGVIATSILASGSWARQFSFHGMVGVTLSLAHSSLHVHFPSVDVSVSSWTYTRQSPQHTEHNVHSC